MANLEAKLRGLIAEIHGISPEEVTDEFIEQKRAELYADPNHRFFDPRGLKVMNQSEIKIQREAADEFLSQFRSPAVPTDSTPASSK